MPRSYKVMDLFCGTGGFSHGICEGLGSGSGIVFALDILPHAIETFKANNPQTAARFADITSFPPSQVQKEFKITPADVDIVVGGPPCQGFTSIRPHRSKNDDDLRNSLYADFLDYVDYFQPKIFVMENVVGLATHNGGKTIRAIRERANSIGYYADWRIVNAANFGVPQRRERLIMVGFRERGEFQFPRPAHRSNGSTIGYFDKSKVISVVPELDDERKLTDPLTAWEAISDLPNLEAGQEITKYCEKPKNKYQERLRGRCEILTLHYATAHSRRMIEIVKKSGYNIDALPKGTVTSGYSTSYSRIEPDKPSVTLTGNFPFPGSNKCIHPFQDRAITPREAARIQSFPDSYIFVGNKTQVAKLIGNAVPPLLGNVIGAWCAQYLEGQEIKIRSPVYQATT